MMEVPTTSNVEALTEFQDLFLEHIRPVAERELHIMHTPYAQQFDSMRHTLIPTSIVMDIMLYMTRHLSDIATEDVMEARDTGDIDKLLESCSQQEPLWRAARALSLTLKVFAQQPAKGADCIPDCDGGEGDYWCYVCGCISPEPLSWAERKLCHGGCPECAEKLEAVFNL